MRYLKTSVKPDSFVKMYINFWDVLLNTIEVAFLPCPMHRSSNKDFLCIIKHRCVVDNYELLGVIKTVGDDGHFSLLLIARKILCDQ